MENISVFQFFPLYLLRTCMLHRDTKKISVLIYSDGTTLETGNVNTPVSSPKPWLMPSLRIPYLVTGQCFPQGKRLGNAQGGVASLAHLFLCIWQRGILTISAITRAFLIMLSMLCNLALNLI